MTTRYPNKKNSAAPRTFRETLQFYLIDCKTPLGKFIDIFIILLNLVICAIFVMETYPLSEATRRLLSVRPDPQLRIYKGDPGDPGVQDIQVPPIYSRSSVFLREYHQPAVEFNPAFFDHTHDIFHIFRPVLLC